MLARRDWLSTNSSVMSSLEMARDSTVRASASSRRNAASNCPAGTRIAMVPLCLDDRSKLTTQPPSSPATPVIRSTERATFVNDQGHACRVDYDAGLDQGRRLYFDAAAAVGTAGEGDRCWRCVTLHNFGLGLDDSGHLHHHRLSCHLYHAGRFHLIRLRRPILRPACSRHQHESCQGQKHKPNRCFMSGKGSPRRVSALLHTVCK